MNLLERLRSETRARHEAMEGTFTLPRTREEHRHRTEQFLGFVEPLEERLRQTLGAHHPFLSGRTKTPWLYADLRALGLSDDDVARLPRCAALPTLDSQPRALGALYVMEGSTLGGQLIARHLESAVGLADGAGYSYFRSYGPDVGRRWQDFRALLQINSTPATDDQVVAAANETFACLQEWFTSSVVRN